MKNYVGVKIVKAKIGTMAEAQALKSRCPVEVQEKIFKKSGIKNEEGYIVLEPDGNVCWMPKEKFDKEYRELDCGDFLCEK